MIMNRMTRGGSLVGMAGMLFLGAAASRCSAPTPAAPAPPAGPALLGDLRPVVSIKELMRDEIDPIADKVFGAVGESVTAQGVTHFAPKNDDDWAQVRMGAVVLAEAANLLKIERPFAPSGEVGDSVGPDATELSPTAMKAKVDGDKALWSAYAEGMRLVAIDVMEIVTRKDTAALDTAAGALDKACENCHLEYWYPGDKKLLKRVAAELEKSKQPGPPGTKP